MEALSIKVEILVLWRELQAIQEEVIYRYLFHPVFFEFSKALRQKDLALAESCHFITMGAFSYSYDLAGALSKLLESGTGCYGEGGICIGDVDFEYYADKYSAMNNPEIRSVAQIMAKEYRSRRLPVQP